MDQADLSVSNLAFSLSTISVGSHPSSLSLALANGGPADLEDTPVWVKLYLSRDTSLDTASDALMGESELTLNLFSGDSMTLTPNVSRFTVPSGATGPYYVFVLVEINQAGLTDPNAANNSARTSGTITVTAR